MHTSHDKMYPNDGSGTLKVLPPYHFGWRIEGNGGGTIQAVNLDTIKHDLILYKEEATFATISIWKQTTEQLTLPMV